MKKFFKSPWTIGIGSTLIGGIATTILIDLFSKVSIWSTLRSVIRFIGLALYAFFNFEIKLWWLLIAISVLIVIIIIYVKYIDATEKSKRPPFWDYTSDSIKGFSWEWKWKKNYEGKYEIEGLQPVCSECKTPLINAEGASFYLQLKCPRCNRKINYDSHVKDEVETLIIDNARKGYYKK